MAVGEARCRRRPAGSGAPQETSHAVNRVGLRDSDPALPVWDQPPQGHVRAERSWTGSVGEGNDFCICEAPTPLSRDPAAQNKTFFGSRSVGRDALKRHCSHLFAVPPILRVSELRKAATCRARL